MDEPDEAGPVSEPFELEPMPAFEYGQYMTVSAVQPLTRNVARLCETLGVPLPVEPFIGMVWPAWLNSLIRAVNELAVVLAVPLALKEFAYPDEPSAEFMNDSVIDAVLRLYRAYMEGLQR